MELFKIPGMMKKISKEIILFSLFSVLCHQSGYLFFFFLIPLQVLKNKKGFNSLFFACVITAAAIFLASIIRTSGVQSPATRLVIIFSEMFLPAVLLTGLLYINYEWPGNPRMLKKMLIVTAGALVAGIPAMIVYNSAVFQNFYKSQIALALEMLNRAFSEVDSIEASDIAAILAGIDAGTVYGIIRKAVLRSYLFAYFAILSVSWWFGSSGIRNGRWKSSFSPSSFSLPEYMVWPLIAALSIVVLDYRVSTGFAGYLAWNILLIMAALYGARGLGILNGLMTAANLPRGLRMLIVFTIVLILMQPGLNYLVLIGVPGLGVSELWINFKRT